MNSLTQHLRQAIRGLRRSPAFTLTVIATLGIGIGLNAAIFTVVDCVLLRPLGYRDADRIVGLDTHFVDKNRSIFSIGGDDYIDLSREVKGLEATAYFHAVGPDGIRLDGTALYVPVALVSPSFMQVMGVEPIAGSVFSAAQPDVTAAMVSAAFARDHFGSPQTALGQTMQYQGKLRTVIGVLPNGFAFPQATSVWFEDSRNPENANRSAYNQRAIAKRRAGVSPAQLAAELATFSAHLQQAYPDDRDKTIIATPLQDEVVGYLGSTLTLLMGAVAAVLLIVCANITHLQLVRATRELRSITIRTALGASRSALALRALLEAALLAAMGCAAALLIAVPALRMLTRLAPPDTPRLTEIHLNLHVIGFSFLLSALMMSLTAALPVWRSWHIHPASAMRSDASRGTETRGTGRLRSSFLVVEIALTLTLCITTLILTRELIRESHQDLGFSPENLVTLDVHAVPSTPPPSEAQIASATAAQIADYEADQSHANLNRLDASLNTVASTPGVLSAAAIDGAPMGFGAADVGYAIRGRQVFGPGVKLPNANIHPVTPGFFSVLGIPLLGGRRLSAEDRLGAPSVLVINQELARTVFPNQDPIGQQMMCGLDQDSSWWTIVGVVGDIREDSPGVRPYPTIYVPIAQHPSRATDMQIVARTRVAPAAMLDTLTRRLKATNPEIAVNATTMRENIGETQRIDDFRTLPFSSFAAVSILLAAVGMYGVTSYTVAQRRFEFGLRIALGADRPQVLRMVLGKALLLAGVGIGIGAGLSLAMTRVLNHALGTLPGVDAAAYGLAALAVLGVALLATFVPARAAANLDPMTVLRSE
jgi:putative ABC transport system permease protein